MRGEFIFGNGLVVPNNFTTAGAELILKRALQDVSGGTLHLGICTGVFDDARLIQDLNEPAFSNGYARQPLAQNNVDWPVSGQVNNEWYVESKDVVFTASGGPFSAPYNRPFLCLTLNGLTGNVIAMGKPLADEILIDVATPLESRTMRYRLYAR